MQKQICLPPPTQYFLPVTAHCRIVSFGFYFPLNTSLYGAAHNVALFFQETLLLT